MQCLEFRRAAGADPRHPGAEALEHARGCPGCAAHLRELRLLDERILAALSIPVPEPAASVPARSAVRVALARDRRRWMALAASIVAGVLVGTLLWLAAPRSSLASALVGHLDHEPGVMVVATQPVDAARLAEVLDRGGLSLRGDRVRVSYAQTCWFRGHFVPHLVVQTARGPVTVMVLRDERVDAPRRFREGGFAGTILPLATGSVAVIGAQRDGLDEIAASLRDAIEMSR